MSLEKRTKQDSKALKFFRLKKVATFTGKQLLEVFEFLASFVVSAEKVPIGDMEAMELVTDFLDGAAGSSIRTAQRTSTARGNEFIWPRVVH